MNWTDMNIVINMEYLGMTLIFFSEWSGDIEWRADHSQSAADRLGDVPVRCREQVRGHLLQRRAQDSR